MNIGFIGAGKVGCTLGKYFAQEGKSVKGYYSLPIETSHEAAHFTNTCSYETAEALIRECDVIFITVPDGSITDAWLDLRQKAEAMSGERSLQDKIICHCSGALTSGEAFPGIEETGATGYSIHPLFAVSDRFNTYKELEGVFFTLEGALEHLEEMQEFIGSMGNPVRVIRGEDKTKYHCAAAVASNLVCGVVDMSMTLMEECGFSPDDAKAALAPIIRGNIEHVIDVGPTEGLTGPIERNDDGTVAKHLNVLDGEEREIYRLLSRRLAKMASRRHPQRDYSGMYSLLEEREKK